MQKQDNPDLSEEDSRVFWRLNTPQKRARMVRALKKNQVGDACYYVCERPQYSVGCGGCDSCKLLLSIYSKSIGTKLMQIIMMALNENA